MHLGIDVRAVRAFADSVDHVDDPAARSYGVVDLQPQVVETAAVASEMPQGVKVERSCIDDPVVEGTAAGDEQFLDQRFKAVQGILLAELGVAAGVAEGTLLPAVERRQDGARGAHFICPPAGRVPAQVILVGQPVVTLVLAARVEDAVIAELVALHADIAPSTGVVHQADYIRVECHLQSMGFPSGCDILVVTGQRVVVADRYRSLDTFWPEKC